MNAYQHHKMESIALGKCILGSILSIILLWISKETLQEWAIVGTIFASVATFGYTVYKWGKEIVSDYRSGKKKIPFRKRK